MSVEVNLFLYLLNEMVEAVTPAEWRDPDHLCVCVGGELHSPVWPDVQGLSVSPGATPCFQGNQLSASASTCTNGTKVDAPTAEGFDEELARSSRSWKLRQSYDIVRM